MKRLRLLDALDEFPRAAYLAASVCNPFETVVYISPRLKDSLEINSDTPMGSIYSMKINVGEFLPDHSALFMEGSRIVLYISF